MESINDNNYIYNKCFYIDGPGGSGKSYLLNSLITLLNNEDINVLPVAWTGIAANLLLSGKTPHATFQLSLNITEDTTCNITPNSEYGKILQNI